MYVIIEERPCPPKLTILIVRVGRGQCYNRLCLFLLQVSSILSAEIASLMTELHVGIMTPILYVCIPILLECCSKGLFYPQVHEYVVFNIYAVRAIVFTIIHRQPPNYSE